MVLLAWIIVLVLLLVAAAIIFFEIDDAWPVAGTTVTIIVISILISRSIGPEARDPIEAANHWAMIAAGVAMAVVAAYLAWRVFGKRGKSPKSE